MFNCLAQRLTFKHSTAVITRASRSRHDHTTTSTVSVVRMNDESELCLFMQLASTAFAVLALLSFVQMHRVHNTTNFIGGRQIRGPMAGMFVSVVDIPSLLQGRVTVLRSQPTHDFLC